MKKYSYFLALTLFYFTFTQTTNAQNLVLNPSFENTAGCTAIPIIGGSSEGFSDLLDWDNANSNTPGDSCSSPDLFSPCNQMPFGGMFPMDFFTGAPGNALGKQCAKTGEKYAGIITNEMGAGLGQSYREYIQGKLSSPLQAGQTYCVSFYISLGDDVTFSTNNIGVFFSNSHYLRDACAQGSLINETPQLNYACQVVAETNQWIRLQWNYVATGGESYFMIGNFFNDANTNIQGTGVTSMNPYAYYYIDEVSVVPGACNYAEIVTTDADGCGGPTDPNGPGFMFCTGDPAKNLTAQEGTTCPATTPAGTWAGPGITNASTGTFNPATAGVGTHTITYTSQSGAVATTTILVSDCQAITVCKENDGSLTASGGTAPFTWQQETTTQDCSACMIGCMMPPNCAVNVTSWADFATGSNIPAPTTYPIKVKDAMGVTLDITSASSLQTCADNPCQTITVSVDNQTDVKCFGQADGSATVSATGGTSPYIYTWTGGLTGATQNALAQGNYTVTATDQNNCTGLVTVTIVQPTALSTTATVDQDADCGMQNGQVTANPQGGTAPYSYSWTGGGTAKTNANLGANTYTVTVTDANNCTATAQATVANTSGFTATVTVDQNENCGQQNGQLTANPQGGTAPYTYSWTGGGTTQTNANLSAGNYTVTVTDANNCTATAQGTIVNNAGFTVQSQVTNPTCLNPTGSATVTPNGGTVPYTYSWSNGDNTANATNLAVGTHTVTVTDATGCSVNETITITANTQQPTVTISGNNAICSGVSTTLTASGATSYSWSTGATTSAITESPTATTTYTVTGTDANGCSATASITVSVLTSADLTISVDTTAGCAPLTVFFTSSIPNADTYTWNFGDGQTSSLASPSHTYYGDSCFAVSLTVDFANGCSYTADLDSLICITPAPTAVFTTSTTEITNVYSEVLFTNQSQNATSYEWNFGDNQTSTDTNPKHTYDPTMISNYVVVLVAENQFGCTDTARVVIKMIEDIIFYVPNTFTPDGDEFNNVFRPVIADGFDAFDFEMLIFNRWGEIVFETHNPKVGWDGTYLGKICPDGTYTWKITIKKTTVDDKIVKSGHVTLLR